MKKRYALIIGCILLTSLPLSAAGLPDPVLYPDGDAVCSTRQLFFWQIEPDGTETPKAGRLLISTAQGKPVTADIQLFSYKNYLYTESSLHLTPGTYFYAIAPADGENLSNARYFGYRKYPVKGSFTAGPCAQAEQPVSFIEYLSAGKRNREENLGNAVFFSGSAIASGAAAALLFTVFRVNIWTDIAGAVCAVSSAAGAGGAGYYAWQYHITKQSIEQNRRQPVSLRGGQPFTISYTAKF